MPPSKVMLARHLAANFLASREFEEIRASVADSLEHDWRWLRPLIRRHLAFTENGIRPRREAVIAFILRDGAFQNAVRRLTEPDAALRIAHWLIPSQEMQPVAAARAWPIPAIETSAELADWLWLEYGQLDWFTDVKQLANKERNPRLAHYNYRVIAKPSGGVRLIEAPKPRLKKIQRQILSEILDNVPPHAACHGFRRHRSVRTFAAPHVHQCAVLRMDLRNFFGSIHVARIQSFFRTCGYPEAVADLMGALCTNATPGDIWPGGERVAAAQYAQRHLPQGAPTSPALANVCAYKLDCRLDGLAQSAGLHYTRYADDLAFSGSEALARSGDRFAAQAAAIALEEGFAVHYRKTRLMTPGTRQHLAGIVVNEHLNIPRPEYDRLKAILTNCVRHGPETQNRDFHPAFREHLAGRVAWAESINPAKGVRLRSLYRQIEWP